MCLESPSIADHTVSAAVSRHSGVIAEAVRRLDQADVGIDDIGLHRPTLDDVFLSLTGRAPEEENGTPTSSTPEEVRA
jgi:ABC-2 type transport system ATP-binding protein